MASKVLLLKDVRRLGRKGEIVSVKPGFARNFLIPMQHAVVADRNAQRIQDRLKEERAKQALGDKKDSEGLAELLNTRTYKKEVKVDSANHMYGSVTAQDIVALLEEDGMQLEKSNILLPRPIKKIGIYPIDLRLKEDVPAKITLKVFPEGNEDIVDNPPVEEKPEKVVASEEESSEESTDEGESTETSAE
jgi:large subunit ribosomal protein L9